MELSTLEATFVDIGGQFISSAFDMQQKLNSVKAYIFDWDGVFNDGRKGKDTYSGYSEIDSLGVSMLRFGHFLHTGKMPLTGIISGEINPSAIEWAHKKNIDVVYLDIQEKQKALEVFTKNNGIKASEICYFYDDILDIPVAEKTGLRMAVGRLANPIFLKYIEDGHLADYISSCQGNEHAVREFCELLLMLMNKNFKVIKSRALYDEEYKQFSERRQSVKPSFYKYSNGVINTTHEYD